MLGSGSAQAHHQGCSGVAIETLGRRDVERVHDGPLYEAGGVRVRAGAVAALHPRALDELGMIVGEDDIGAKVRVARRERGLPAPAVRVLDPRDPKVRRVAGNVDPIEVAPVIEDAGVAA